MNNFYYPTKKILKGGMILSFLLFFLFSAETVAQQTKNNDITLHVNNALVENVFKQITEQTNYKFLYDNTIISNVQKVTINKNKATLENVLSSINAQTNLQFKVDKKTILVSLKKSNAPENISQNSNALLGTVYDMSGEPIIGASVTVKGKANGTITDLNGCFSLQVNPKETLVISFVGYKTQTVSIGNKNNIKITLADDVEMLDEVVVVGYGTMKKSDLTGSVVSANLKDFKDSPNTNIVQSLQGTVPGLNIGQTTSAGSTPSISIRGENTISGNSNVLIVLDGIIYTSSLSSLNPNDIASIDVLKDASATSVYGAQAANGVLLITTKKGASGKTKINFSSSYTISNPTKNLRPMNRQEYLQYTKDYWYDKAYTGDDYSVPNPDFKIVDYLPDTPMLDTTQADGISALDYNWWKNGTQTGHIFENRLSASGGNDIMAYMLSYENTDQEGFVKNDEFKRNSVRINLDITPNKWLKFGVQSFASFINQDGAEPDLGSLMRSCPLISPYDEEGNIVAYPFNTLDENPFRGSNVQDKERHNYFFANAFAEVKLPVKGLTYRVNYGNNYRIDNHKYSSVYGASLTGEAYKNHAEYYDYTLDNILNYNGQFGKHSIGATFLYGASERKYDYTNADGQNYSRLTLGYDALELATNQFIYSDAWNEALLYQMGRVNYKYDDKYLVTATVRRDGFSGFAKNNKFATFPSVALAWVISREKFFNVPWVDQLKLRAGWGISGNHTSRYKSLSKVESSPSYVFGDGGTTEIGQKLSTMSNKNLKWEKTEGLNFGLDFNLLNNSITGSIDAYFNTTRDLLYDLAIPTIVGFSSVSSNIGELRNKGIEFTLTSRNIQTKDFEWNTTVNFSANTNKIISLTGVDNDGDGKEDDLIASNLFIGEALQSIYDYKINGIWQLNDEIPTGYHPGNYRVVDVTGEGTISVDDKSIIGKKAPAYRFGILNSFRYKSFNLSFFINSIQGGKNGYLAANSETIVRGDANSRRWNRPSELAFDYWSPSNPNATYSRSIQGGAITPTLYQDRSFIRLQDVNLGYTFPHSISERLGLENLNLFVSGKNLITITKWKGWDPEAGSGYYGRPVLRSFSFGLNLTL